MSSALHGTARRLALTGLAAFGLIMAAPAIAAADASYTTSDAVATSDGAELRVRKVYVDREGRAYYSDSYYVATAHNAFVHRTESVSDAARRGAD